MPNTATLLLFAPRGPRAASRCLVSDPPSDRALIARSAAGDADAFASLYDRHGSLALAVEHVELEARLHDRGARHGEERADPELDGRAFLVARALGDEERARRHFEAAERGFRVAIDAGEVYTLGALARLYCDAGVRLDAALGLARRNLEYRRDIEAKATLADVRGKLGPDR